MTNTAASRLYFRSAWQKTLDDNKIDMGLMPPVTQDQLDHDLVCAVADRHDRGVAEMAALGADVNRALLSPVDGRPLHLAVVRGGLKTLVTLLHAGADPFLTDSRGQTPRDLATALYAQGQQGSGRMRTVLKQWEQRQLREAGGRRAVSGAISGSAQAG
jgi:hypothetical protein